MTASDTPDPADSVGASDTDTALPKSWDPSAVEADMYQGWVDAGYFTADPTSDKPPYSIVLPPPNVTGSLHMGHAFQQTLMDTLIRYNRMQGKNTLWQAGTDHAGIATQMVVERKITFEHSSVTIRGEVDPFAPRAALISAEYHLDITRY